MLKATDRNNGGRPEKTSTKEEPVSPTLRDLGIDKKISSLAQKIADLPEEKVEAVAKRVHTIADVQRERLDNICTVRHYAIRGMGG